MIERPIKYRNVAGSSDFTINDGSKKSLLVAPYYHISVDSVDGFWGADISFESHPIPGATGEVSGDIYRRGKTITVSGTITARGLSELRQGQRYLAEMLNETSAKRKFIFQLWNDNFEIYIWCRPIQDLAMVERIDTPNSNFKVLYTFALKADKPYTYKLSDNTLYPTWQT